MPIVVSPEMGLTLPVTVCDYKNPETNLMQEEQFDDASNIIEAVRNYESFIAAEIPAHSESMIFSSNFRMKDIKKLVEDNSDCGFVRIYLARNPNGSQFTIAVPVQRVTSGLVKQTHDVKYYINCCACKPNCGGTGSGF